jgi:hypothetical protein
MAQSILLGWESIKFKGQPLSYSTENARTLLGVKDFRAHVSRLAHDFDAYRVAQEESTGKN